MCIADNLPSSIKFVVWDYDWGFSPDFMGAAKVRHGFDFGGLHSDIARSLEHAWCFKSDGRGSLA